MSNALVERLALDLGMPLMSIRRLIATAPFRYKRYEIPKRSGHGKRLIAQPAKELKKIQRLIVLNELSRLPIHQMATAYVKGKNIKVNAIAHVKNNFLLKADFSDFFPSIKSSDLALHIKKHLPSTYSEDELDAICRLLFWHNRPRSPLELCIGAPSSPFISNTLMFEFDSRVQNFVSSRGITYTRYADDISFSTNEVNVLREVLPMLRNVLNDLQYPTIHLNEKKTIFSSKKNRRIVTGLVLASQGYVSLGRERKRLIHSMVHRFSLGKLNESESQKLKGLLAFVEDVEPKFLLSLRRKYSNETIEVIRQSKLIEGGNREEIF